MTINTLVWFRQDLRLKDNPALQHALAQGPILPVYIDDQANTGPWKMGEASRWWLHHSLQRLNKSLGGQLHCFAGDPLAIIPRLLKETGIEHIVWNRCYEPWQIQRDSSLKSSLEKRGIHCQSFNGSLLWEPWQVKKPDGTPYKVFTPFYRKGCLKLAAPDLPLPAPAKKLRFTTLPAKAEKNRQTIEQLQLLPRLNWHHEFPQFWKPGEEGAGDKLQQFLQDKLTGYDHGRNIPARQGTSGLSPHLHFGEISPRQVWHATLSTQGSAVNNADIDQFLTEIVWREFSYYQLFHCPQLPEGNFQPKFNRFPWQKNQQQLSAWQQGQTGIPIVDAGMRELARTGFMQNRVRMICASFLTKNLLQDWRDGASWFWDYLLDADLANNSASWQWVAGCGADAAPYFRIFNPVLQGQKFDKDGEYVKRYCPELAQLPAKFIHSPWEAPQTVLDEAGIELGNQYPQPMVDLKLSRELALEAYAQIK